MIDIGVLYWYNGRGLPQGGTVNSETVALIARWHKNVFCKCGRTFEVRFADLVLSFEYGRQGTRYYRTAVRCTCQDLLNILVPDEIDLEVPTSTFTFNGLDNRMGDYRHRTDGAPIRIRP